MQNIPQEQVIKRFQMLPDAIKDAIFSRQTIDAILKYCALRDVPENKMHLVGDLTTTILLGYLRPELFALEIQKETGMDMQKAQLIAQDLDAEIFSAVRLELKKLYPPTIQTPTVQTWRAESQPTPAPSASSGQAKPRYVIPIPEKFLRPEILDQRQTNQYGEARPPTTGSINYPEARRPQIATQTSDSQWAEVKPQPTPAPDSKTNSSGDDLKPAGGDQVSAPLQTQKATNSATTGGVQQAEVKPQEPPISPPVPTLKANEAPSFKPIVPLPTFIQTQFKTTQVSSQKPESQKDDAVSTPLSDDPQIKNLISKFTSSSTQKPKPPAESPYREKV